MKFFRNSLVKTRCVLILVFVFSAFGCMKDPQITSISDFEILERKDSVLFVSLTANIENPNKINITASDLNYQISIEDKEIGSGSVIKEFTLPANAETSVKNDLALNIPNLLNSIDLILENDSFPADISMQFKISPLGIKINKRSEIYFKADELTKNLSGDLIKESLQVKGLKIKEIKPQSTLLRVKFNFDNKFPLEYRLDTLSVTVFDTEKKEALLGHALHTETILFPAKENTNFGINVRIKNLNTGFALLKKVFTKDKSFFMQGYVVVNFEQQSFRVPISQTIEPV